MSTEENKAKRSYAQEESTGEADVQAHQVTHINASRQAWRRAAVLVGVAYFLIGKVFALPANDLRFWRLAAWVADAGATW